MKFPVHDEGPRSPIRLDSAVLSADIYALAEDCDELRAFGVVLGRFDALLGCFEGCMLTRSSLRRLAQLGGKYLWDLGDVPASGRAVGEAPRCGLH